MNTPGTALIAVLAALALAAGGCGGDDDDGASSSGGTGNKPAASSGGGGGDPEATMRAYFTAINAGDTKAICDLADDTLEMFLYNGTGDACLKNASNQNAQPAIPTGDQIKIASQTVEGDSAQYVVEDPKGATIQVGLQRVDGRWFVHVFT